MTTRRAYRPPYDELYIYYLQGRITSDTLLLGATFIGNWEEDGYTFLFFSEPAEPLVRALATRAPGLVLLDQYHMTYEDWQGGHLYEFRVGPFMVRAPWASVAPANDLSELTILLDPGVVFGAGNHPTTRDCLAAMAWLHERRRISSTLDLGTGTGILAIAAARIGCRRVLAVDLNRLAAETTQRNVILNGAVDRVCTLQGRAEELVDCPVELLVANIHFDVMQRILNAPGFARKQYAILSGLLRSQARELETMLSCRAMPVLRRWSQDDIWHTYLVQCRPESLAAGHDTGSKEG